MYKQAFVFSQIFDTGRKENFESVLVTKKKNLYDLGPVF